MVDKNRAKLPHKSSAARTSEVPRAQVLGRPHRMPGRAHKSSDGRTECRDVRTDSQDCRTASRMSAQVPGRAHSVSGPSVLVVCHAHSLPDTRTGHLTSRLRDVNSRGRKLDSLLRKLGSLVRKVASRLRKLIECGRRLIIRTRKLPPPRRKRLQSRRSNKGHVRVDAEGAKDRFIRGGAATPPLPPAGPR